VPSNRSRVLVAACALAGISVTSAWAAAGDSDPQQHPVLFQASAGSVLTGTGGSAAALRQLPVRADRDLARPALTPSGGPILPAEQGISSTATPPTLTLQAQAATVQATLQEQAAALVARQKAADAAAKAAAKAKAEAAAAKAEADRLAKLHRWVRPNYGSLSSPFSMRWGRMHNGIDLAGRYGSPILAATAGTVLYAGPESGYGEVLKIQDWDGTQTWYGHMSKFLVKAGDKVTPGQEVALVGAAGDATGPHLHFEVRINGNPVNPVPFLAARGIHI